MQHHQPKTISLRALLKLEQQIKNKRHHAKRDGIAFTLTHEQLLELALSSPHWQKLGCTKGSYQICRHDHSLGYTIENTFIGSALENNRERLQRCGNPKYGHNFQSLAGLTPEQKRQRRRNQRRENYAKKKAAAALTRCDGSTLSDTNQKEASQDERS
jgi:hypothetical protein